MADGSLYDTDIVAWVDQQVDDLILPDVEVDEALGALAHGAGSGRDG